MDCDCGGYGGLDARPSGTLTASSAAHAARANGRDRSRVYGEVRSRRGEAAPGDRAVAQACERGGSGRGC